MSAEPFEQRPRPDPQLKPERPKPFTVIDFVVTNVEAGVLMDHTGPVTETVTFHAGGSMEIAMLRFEAPVGTWRVGDKVEMEGRRR